MRIVIKYLLWLFSFITLILFYLLNTSLGHKTLGNFFGEYLSKRSKNHIEVLSLNIDRYPYIIAEVKINHGAEVVFRGNATRDKLDLDYHLVGDSFTYGKISLDERLDVIGHLWGTLKEPSIVGKGQVFNGTTQFSFVKSAHLFKDIDVKLKGVDSVKVLNFLHKPPLVVGQADIDAKFKYWSTEKKDGEAEVLMNKATMPSVSGDVPFKLATTVIFQDLEYRYQGEITSDIGTLKIKNGYYHTSKHEAKANYLLDLKELAYFEKFLKHKYSGTFQSEGVVYYKKELEVKGRTKKFGGVLEYTYKGKSLNLNLEGVSLVQLLKFFSYPALLDAKVYGSIDYAIVDKIVLIDTDLKETRFRKTKMTDMILSTTGIDMLKEVYNESSFMGGYQNSVLSSVLKIDNGRDHIYLTETKMNSKTNSIDSDFEIKMRGEELAGEIYGTLKDPKVSINMRKLLNYQLNKQLSGLFGTTNKKEILDRGLNSVKKDITNQLKEIDIDGVTNKAKNIIEGFF